MPAVIRRLNAADARALMGGLVDVLCDAVDGGASVSFLPPMDRGEARRFWEGVAAAVEQGHRLLLVADDNGAVRGTVQLDLIRTPNQKHRAEVMKLLVHRHARRQGVGRQLMLALEEEARRAGRSLITLDTQTGAAAEPLYAALGYQAVGVLPRFALLNGELVATTFMYKEI